MKNKKNKIMILVGILSMIVCFFICPEIEAKAMIDTDLTYIENGYDTITFSEELPAEVTNPIDKGKKLLSYLIISFGAIALLVGIVFCVIGFIGHQPDQRLNGFIMIGAGIILIAAPVIVNWIAGTPLF